MTWNLGIRINAKRYIVPLFLNELEQYNKEFKEFIKTSNFEEVDVNLKKRDELVDVLYRYEHDIMGYDNSVSKEYEDEDSNIIKIYYQLVESFSDRLIYYWIEDLNKVIDVAMTSFSFTDRFREIWGGATEEAKREKDLGVKSTIWVLYGSKLWDLAGESYENKTYKTAIVRYNEVIHGFRRIIMLDQKILV